MQTGLGRRQTIKIREILFPQVIGNATNKNAGTDMASKHSGLIISYLTLRRAIGVLGLTLPFVLFIGGMTLFSLSLAPTISDYYHTPMRDVFVGFLCAIGVFMLSYKGYALVDDLAGDLAGVFAIGVALLPTTPDIMTHEVQSVIGTLHLVCAALFFLVLAYFCLFLFTKTDPSKPMTRNKRRRNLMYRICGVSILLALAGIAVLKLMGPDWPDSVIAAQPIFWLETWAVVAFGVSWLTKGEAILADG